MSTNTPYEALDFHVWGDYALFTDPMTSLSGELCSYQIPTFSALRGIAESIYWKPTISWRPVAVRIMNPIRFEARAKKLPNFYTTGCDLGYRTYLRNVSYQVRVALEWSNDTRYEEDRNFAKHINSARRWLKRGGRMPIVLGTSDCMGFVEPCDFESHAGYYDDIDMSMGIMFHSHTYANQAYNKETTGKLTTNMWACDMHNGIVTFPEAKDCPIHRILHDAKPIWVNPSHLPDQKGQRKERVHESVK